MRSRTKGRGYPSPKYQKSVMLILQVCKKIQTFTNCSQSFEPHHLRPKEISQKNASSTDLIRNMVISVKCN